MSELDDLWVILQTYGVPKGNIWAVENSTPDTHYEDAFRDVDLLKILLQALYDCDHTIDRIRRKKGIPKPQIVYKPRSKLSNDIKEWLDYQYSWKIRWNWIVTTTSAEIS